MSVLVIVILQNLLTTYHVPGTVLDVAEETANKRDHSPALSKQDCIINENQIIYA